jgi:hypothetical protein
MVNPSSPRARLARAAKKGREFIARNLDSCGL